jgi:hypothetical protein
MKIPEWALEVHELSQLPAIYPYLCRETSSDGFKPIKLPARGKLADEISLYIHSSGSTGMPKAIPISGEVCSKLPYQSFISGVQNYDESFRESSRRLLPPAPGPFCFRARVFPTFIVWEYGCT